MSFREHTVEGGEALDTSVRVLGGRYEIQSTLGTGGMAVVYKAEDAILGRPVALKTLHRRYAEEPTFRRRFKQEARAMASLDHENIVKVYDICQDGEVPFIVAECVAGRDIGSLLHRDGGGRLNEQFTRRVAAQLLRALSYAHRRGVIHRDIKPSNVLVTHEGKVKVADFGIARIVEEDDAVEPGEIIGSARYMSPEPLRGKEATPRSDIYSVGILLYHCLTGSPPFSGDLKDLARQQIHDAPTPPRRLNKNISRHLEGVILKALAKDPDDRYASASAMLAEVQVDPPAKSAGGTTETPHSKAPRKGRGRMLLLAPILALLLAGGGTALAMELGYLNQPPERDGVEVALNRPNLVEGEPAEAPEPPPEPAPPPEDASEESAGAGREDTAAPLVPVPDVRKYFDYSAAEILASSGFDVEFVYAYRSRYANRGVVWGTDPAVGTLAPQGSTITVYATPEDLRQPQIRG